MEATQTFYQPRWFALPPCCIVGVLQSPAGKAEQRRKHVSICQTSKPSIGYSCFYSYATSGERERKSMARRRWLHTCVCVVACITSLSKPREMSLWEKKCFLKSHEETSVCNICMWKCLKMAESNFRVILYVHVFLSLRINFVLQVNV